MYEEWLALAVETEGCIGVYDNAVGISFTNTCKMLIDKYVERANALGCRTHVSPPNKGCYSVAISGTHKEPGHVDKLIFLQAIEPFLFCKQVKAQDAISWLERRIIKRGVGDPRNFMESNMWYHYTEIADKMKLPRTRVSGRLYSMHRQGLLIKKQGGGRRVYWKLPEP